MFSLYASRVGLLACAVGLVVWTAVTANEAPVLSAVLNLRFTGFGAGGIGSVFAAAFASLLPFMLVGAFASASLHRRADDPSEPTKRNWQTTAVIGTLVRGLLGWCLATLLAVLCVTAGSIGQAETFAFAAPGWFELAWIALGTCIGCVFGSTLRLPVAAAMRSAALTTLLCLIVISSAVLLLRNALLDEQPSALPIARITSAEKRDLVELARIHNPFRLGDQATLLYLPPQHLNMLLAWSVSIFNPASRAQVTTQQGAMQAAVSVPAPTKLGGGNRYVNASLQLQGVLSGKTALQINQCNLRIGRLSLANHRCSFVVRGVYNLVARHASADSALNSLHRLTISAQGISANYSAIRLDPNGRSALRGLLGPSPAVQDGIVAQYGLLRSLSPVDLRSTDAFGATLRQAFVLASARAEDSDAVSENQAAILALATVLGHHDVASAGGFERPVDLAALRAKFDRLSLRGRDDWRKHFLVSAALTQISSTLLSDAAGLLKEELDADGPSGFSFADLQMDRAGTLFGEAIARDSAHAESMQQWIIHRYDLDCIAPGAEDMPEGISDAELQRRFGGVGGAGYTLLIKEIEQRVTRCAAYRS